MCLEFWKVTQSIYILFQFQVKLKIVFENLGYV